MRHDDLDRKMRVYETAHDFCVPPGVYIVARLDGRGFTRLTKQECRFETPFDERFRDLMIHTTRELMDSGFQIVYGYTESDEISILFDLNEGAFNRKLRKINSILAGVASSAFSLELGRVGTFDCRVSQLPSAELVVDYFRWRNEDAGRNSLNSYCYWKLRDAGLDARAAADRLLGMSVAAKNEFLYRLGVNFNDVPGWQKRGVGLYWQEYQKSARNPVTGEAVTARRRRLAVDVNLPMKEEYGEFVRGLISSLQES